ncbi:two-component system phosphate regulon response regulator PhoB [Thermosporothrix hazakensis]|jgi:DNA-binding response OmpR family regulator|uniref:Two-component system phosphate regulon response regulator PhoB n=2 Tax=Thermosporothrix TaxID=768650 RepID=A0A326UA26_THEHA|nr:response regulator [Thermosporothrix hazakensis]PZW32941.1 two-component system phosphate regulon response regulator PhoB [Thermosporothrix hazakensis]BBH90923.1 hypothetical protein KTC_56740 [Thermosporothrix sp. COM3]GCE48973.1 hypothetical protein KTH_38420 [Thermosporothrix hazakensis]
MHVGLLEDDLAIQEMVMLVLQDEGYTVTVFAEAEQCLEALGVTTPQPQVSPVDVMIIDWRLNGSMSGIEVIRRIRSCPHLQSLPIILTTAATFTDTEELQNLNVSLLEKPFSVDEIIMLIKQKTGTLPSS